MDKYGVDTDPKEDGKTAEADRDTCPLCGAELEDLEQTGQKKCPDHGTAPFER